MPAATASSLSTPSPSKGLNIGLWVVQVLLATMFGFAGATKTFTPIADLVTPMPWVAHVPELLVRFIGVSELAAALGLTLPSLLRIKPALTVFAALGLVIVMVLAAGLHVQRGEYGGLPINAVLGGLAAFVAWGRSKKAPISPRA